MYGGGASNSSSGEQLGVGGLLVKEVEAASGEAPVVLVVVAAHMMIANVSQSVS